MTVILPISDKAQTSQKCHIAWNSQKKEAEASL